jgi:multidrug resistance efflux pump
MIAALHRAGRIAVTLVVVLIAVLTGWQLWAYYMEEPWTRDGRVRADVVTIAPDVAGFVTDLRIKDNQVVKKGDILFALDQERYKLALAAAEANVAARKAEFAMAQSNAARRAKMTAQVISQEEKDDSVHVAEAANAAYQQALADRETASLNLERTVVRAPVNGYVTNLTLVIGQYAAVGTKVMALIDSDSYRVEGYFEETKLPRIKLGDPVEIRLMSGDPPLHGHVESISRGITDRDNVNGPELLANVNPTFEWVRLAQRIPVRVHIDQIPEDVHISAGMTCTVIVSGSPSTWSLASLFE